MKALGLAALISSAALSGCNRPAVRIDTTPVSERTFAYSVDANKGHKVGKVTQNRASYDLERIIVNGEIFYTRHNEVPSSDEYSVLLYRKEDTIREEDPMTREVKLISETAYIPTRVVNDKGMPASLFTFEKEGKFGIKMTPEKYDVSNIGVGVIHSTEQEEKFNVGTVIIPFQRTIQGRQTISGIEFYTPIVEQSNLNTDHGKLNFYMIEVEGAKKRRFPDGTTLGLSTQRGIYRPVKINVSDYEARIRARDEAKRIADDIAKKNQAPINLPGQAGKVE